MPVSLRLEERNVLAELIRLYGSGGRVRATGVHRMRRAQVANSAGIRSAFRSGSLGGFLAVQARAALSPLEKDV
ncbi:uncharacterized [Tachysurus ichikawai]